MWSPPGRRGRSTTTRRHQGPVDTNLIGSEPYEHDVNRRLRKLYPMIRERENGTILPRRWDISQASSYLEITHCGLTTSFKKNVSLNGDKDPSGVVRADNAIPSCVGLYYFEVEIVHGVRGCMGVGLSKGGGDLNRMPGWDAHCFGYHGDDGNFFSACGHGAAYGPKFGTGDVIGCGIDTVLKHVFFTKNGKHLGIAFVGKEPFEMLYPTVGLKTQGEQLQANFGQKPFVFDFESYRDNSNYDKIRKIDEVKMPLEIGTQMEKSVLSFLAHSGNLETLQQFEGILGVKSKADIEFLRKRKEIQQMIVTAGRGAEIQAKLEEYFPNILDSNPRVQLILMCLRFIDLATILKEKPTIGIKNGDGVLPNRGKGSKSSQKRSRPDRSRSQPRKFSQPTEKPENLVDEDTGEELMNIDGVVISKNMYYELTTNEEYPKVVYLIKMSREINNLAKTFTLSHKDRNILENSITIILNSNPIDHHPLKNSDLQYISNLVTEMINNHDLNLEDDDMNDHEKSSPTPNVAPESNEPSHVATPRAHLSGENNIADEVAGKKEKVHSDLRGMFIGWQGLHAVAAKRNHASAGISFFRDIVVTPKKFGNNEIMYNEEPIERGELDEVED